MSKKCSLCNADISEYEQGITLCVYCDPDIDTEDKFEHSTQLED